jgi:two-component system phosphate regulon sensor histidine kinase PhoR
MILTIAGVTGFLLFWLKQTYNGEEKTLSIKTDAAFRDAIQQLQVSKLKLDSIPGDSSGKKVQVFADRNFNEEVNVQLDDRNGIVSTINVIRKRIGDSLTKDPSIKKGIIVSGDHRYFDNKLNLPGTVSGDRNKPNRDDLFRLLYGVDSLQDSLKINEIKTALNERLEKQQIKIPFIILRLDSTYESREPVPNEVTVGFASPVTYRLQPGNTFPYLLKRISLPIMFSLSLFAITILSFALLYRNLLRQRRLTAIKNEFIGNITHELKTPIATVSVAIEAMKKFNALQNPERTQEYLDISANELQRLSLLVDKVLSLSKFEKNEVEIKKERFDLVQLIEEVMGSMKLQFEKQHAITTLETTGINFMIEADQRHVSSVLYNLLDNALKYCRENPIINVHVIDQTGYLEIRVRDNGIGIAAEYNRKIFDQFFRVPHGDMHNVKGYGLGLSYVNYIVKSHHGFIEVESELGKGSTFIVKLPFAEAPVIYYDKNRRIIKKDFKS